MDMEVAPRAKVTAIRILVFIGLAVWMGWIEEEDLVLDDLQTYELPRLIRER